MHRLLSFRIPVQSWFVRKVHPWRLTWHWKNKTCSIGNISSNGGFSIVMLVFGGGGGVNHVQLLCHLALKHGKNSCTPEISRGPLDKPTLIVQFIHDYWLNPQWSFGVPLFWKKPSGTEANNYLGGSNLWSICQGIVGCTPGPTYPMGNPYISPI